MGWVSWRRQMVGWAGLVFALALSEQALAADLQVFSTPTVKAALAELLPAFERAHGHRVRVLYEPVGALKRRLDSGERCDVAILVPGTADELIRAGRLAAASRIDLARAGYGVAVRAGATRPDVSTVEALTAALAAAHTLSYSPDSNSSAYFVALLDRLGLGAQTQQRLRPVEGAQVVEAVARGDAELTVITLPNIVAARGVDLAGPLPAALQNYSVFTAAVGSGAQDPLAAQALLDFLAAPAATPAFNSQGLERVPR